MIASGVSGNGTSLRPLSVVRSTSSVSVTGKRKNEVDAMDEGNAHFNERKFQDMLRRQEEAERHNRALEEIARSQGQSQALQASSSESIIQRLDLTDRYLEIYHKYIARGYSDIAILTLFPETKETVEKLRQIEEEAKQGIEDEMKNNDSE